MRPGDDDLRSYTGELTLLCVDDCPFTLEQIRYLALPWFAQVVTARDGLEALELVRSCRPDLILSDQTMPSMSGLQMARELRDLGDRTPLILMTASLDLAILTEAIDLGFSKFIPKPLSKEALASACRAVAREVAAERLKEKNRRQELELHRYREQYQYQQQELAGRKEAHLLRNDLRRRSVTCGAPTAASRWFVDIGYHPQQVLCGDGFMVRQLSGGDALVFIVDAMGSGLSASLTSMCTTAYLNHLIDLHQEEQRYDFRRTVLLFLNFARTMLLPEEVLSCGFLHLDSAGAAMVAALFGLPPLLARRGDQVIRIRGDNPPVSRYMTDFRSQELDLAGLDSLLITTDGMTDAVTRDRGSYREWLEQDFRSSFFARDLERHFLRRVSDCFDDLTFICLSRIDSGLSGQRQLSVASLASEACRAVEWVEQYCAGIDAAGPDFQNEAAVVATEAIMNAFEHGCLGLCGEQKARLMERGEYPGFLAGATGAEGEIRIEVATRQLEEGLMLVLTVSDSGPGFDPGQVAAGPVSGRECCGRGLGLIRKYTDNMLYNRRGNSLCLLKQVY